MDIDISLRVPAIGNSVVITGTLDVGHVPIGFPAETKRVVNEQVNAWALAQLDVQYQIADRRIVVPKPDAMPIRHSKDAQQWPVPTFSLVYTSCRPNCIVPTVLNWLARAQAPRRAEVIVTVDKKDFKSVQAANLLPISLAKIVTQPDEPYNCVKGWNLGAIISTGQILVVISDDFVPPVGWDVQLLTAIAAARKSLVDSDFVIKVSDGYVNKICTLPILSRSWYQKLGHIYHPRYESMFADDEFTDRAAASGILLDASNLLFEHVHCGNGKRVKDSVDLNHASKERWDRGQAVYAERKAAGFPKD